MRKLPPILLLPLVVYIALAGHQLRLPGLHNDEAQEAGLPALQLVGGGQVTTFRDVGVGPRHYPLMVQDYIGAINVYLVAPFVALLGPSVVSVRLPSLLVGVATLMTTFGFTSAIWGKRAAFLAAGLLAINPSFVFWSRQGVLIASLTLMLSVSLMWVGFNWARRGGWQWALPVGFLAGLGIYAKILFVWVVLGLVGAVVVLNLPLLWHRTWRAWPRRPTLGEGCAASIGLIVGLLPLLVFNLISGGTLLSESGAVIATEHGAMGNLSGRIDHFRAVLTGRNHLWYLGGSAANMLWEWAISLSAIVILVRSLEGRSGSRSGLALLVTLFLGLVQVPFTPTVAGMFPHHLAVFAPLWVVLVAVAFDSTMSIFNFRMGDNPDLKVIETGTSTRHPMKHLFHFGWIPRCLNVLGMTLLCLALLALVGRDLQVNLFYHRVLRQSGGEGPHSAAIYLLVDELETRHPSMVVALDWGFAPQLRYLTGDRIIPHDVFGYTPEVDHGLFAHRMDPLLATPGAVFVDHWPNETLFPRRQAFERAAAAKGFDVERQAIISSRTGAPKFELLAVTPN